MGRAVPLAMIALLGLAGGEACGADDSAGDAAVGDAARPDGGEDAAMSDAAVDPDAGPCGNDGALDDPCARDCDCLPDLACRGLPGETVCAVPCVAPEDCATTALDCTTVTCEPTVGACRCQCEAGDCGDDVCFATWCVGCARDADCAGHPCGSTPGLDAPRWCLDTGACDGGGACGGAVCDRRSDTCVTPYIVGGRVGSCGFRLTGARGWRTLGSP